MTSTILPDMSQIKGLALDSRAVKPGYVFAALPGTQLDGRAFIEDAIRNGATHILTSEEEGKSKSYASSSVQILTSPNPRRDLGMLAAEFYGQKPAHITAITGTNGKTSVAHFAQQLWNAAGHNAVSMGTLGVHGRGIHQSGSLTTPDVLTLHETLATLAKGGVTHAALEASSHGLDQYRLDGLRIKVAAFTNLSRDHLDYHSTMDAYKNAKKRLFAEILEPGGAAVLNADSPEYEELREISQKRGHKILSYGFKGNDLKIIKLTPSQQGQKATLEILGKQRDVTIPLVGEFQVYNALCALGIVLVDDAGDVDALIQDFTKLNPVPGRLQSIAGHPAKAGIYVDYAHTPDALSHVLKAVRPHVPGKLVCVLGCGGNRDTGKRPEMGRAACAGADHVIVTDDNPRSESPEKIRKDILDGCFNATEIGDRANAITQAIRNLTAEDTLVIAGKGHEQGQILADKTIPFDDVKQAEQAIKEMSNESV